MSESPKRAKANLADVVLVTTREAIGGQREHAAIITCVHSDVLVNVMVLPAIGQPYPIASVAHVNQGGAITWRSRSTR